MEPKAPHHSGLAILPPIGTIVKAGIFPVFRISGVDEGAFPVFLTKRECCVHFCMTLVCNEMSRMEESIDD
jgi:hypothetical protein